MLTGNLGGFRRHGGMAAQALHDASGVEGVAAPKSWVPPHPQTPHPATSPTVAKVATLWHIRSAVASRLIHPGILPGAFISECHRVLHGEWSASPCFKGGCSTSRRSHYTVLDTACEAQARVVLRIRRPPHTTLVTTTNQSLSYVALPATPACSDTSASQEAAWWQEALAVSGDMAAWQPRPCMTPAELKVLPPLGTGGHLAHRRRTQPLHPQQPRWRLSCPSAPLSPAG